MTQFYNKSDLLILDKNIPDIISTHKRKKFEHNRFNDHSAE